MLKIKNGKLIASNISLALPENFYINLQGGDYHILEFYSEKEIIKDGKIIIDIEFEDAELNAEETMKELIEDNSSDLKYEFSIIKRGKGTAITTHILSSYKDYYEERYDFKPDILNHNQVTVSIYLMSTEPNKLVASILDVLNFPNIKAFLKSIKYF